MKKNIGESDSTLTTSIVSTLFNYIFLNNFLLFSGKSFFSFVLCTYIRFSKL